MFLNHLRILKLDCVSRVICLIIVFVFWVWRHVYPFTHVAINDTTRLDTTQSTTNYRVKFNFVHIISGRISWIHINIMSSFEKFFSYRFGQMFSFLLPSNFQSKFNIICFKTCKNNKILIRMSKLNPSKFSICYNEWNSIVTQLKGLWFGYWSSPTRPWVQNSLGNHWTLSPSIRDQSRSDQIGAMLSVNSIGDRFSPI